MSLQSLSAVMNPVNWVSITKQPVKRKRAERACEFCHSKKVKCDLVARRAQQQSKCSSCASADRECRLRSSRRVNSGRRRAVTLSKPAKDGNGSSLSQQPLTLPTTSDNDFVNLPTPPSIEALEEHTIPALSTIHHDNGTNTQYSTELPSTRLAASRVEQGYHPDTGFGYVYARETSSDARDQERLSIAQPVVLEELPDPDLQQSFLETYFEYCYSWCPIVDRATASSEISRSPMLANSIALVGSHLKPPLMEHTKPEVYYNCARKKFYEDEETDGLIAMKALCLFYWWSPRPPTTVHRHSSWWWQSVIIRHCQQQGIHREPTPQLALQMGLDLNIRRRIWWTAFARERLTALCQSRPFIIDPDDCNVQELTPDDFPDSERAKGEVFIYWVRLCALIGKIAKHISRSFDCSTAFPTNLARDLVHWVNSLPPHLKISIHSDRTTNFNRDAHQLHLPYLAIVIILHLKKSSMSIPQAYPPAVLAATCIARIFKDILARGDTRFLMGITCWYSGTAFMALQQACRSQDLAASANEDVDIITMMIDQLRKMWPTANIFHRGFQRLRAETSTSTMDDIPSNREPKFAAEGSTNYDGGGIEYTAYFPFASAQTSKLAATLFASEPLMDDIFTKDAFPDGMNLDIGTFFEPFGSFVDLENCF